MDETLRHEMVMTTTNEREAFFECPVQGCGRNVVLDRTTLAMRVLHPGCSGVLHRGSTAATATHSAVA
ncbi:MAG: hypothetical protein IT196_04125 [Acidimicrobiales bacterium]|nr:hypothetical protein [Acidimicrobiales bacterium]